MESLRCQVRVLVDGEYKSCGAKATHVIVIGLEGTVPNDNYAILLCVEHESGAGFEIGPKPPAELRNHSKRLGALPTF
jgi:hypothetical protein